MFRGIEPDAVEAWKHGEIGLARMLNARVRDRSAQEAVAEFRQYAGLDPLPAVSQSQVSYVLELARSAVTDMAEALA